MENKIVRIHVIDDDEFFGNVTQKRLELLEYTDVSLYTNAEDFCKDLVLKPDIAIIDYDLPSSNGIEILEKVKKTLPDTFAIIISGQKDLMVVIEAYEKEADRYIMKDGNSLIELVRSMDRIHEIIENRRKIEALQLALIQSKSYENIIGESDVMRKLFFHMSKVENTLLPVLISGSNGTGKELVANGLHFGSNRKRAPFIAINVAAIPEDLIESELFGCEKGAFTGSRRRSGKFEDANGGTIFLDEIAEMPLPMQAKLLRVLQENSVTRLGGKRELKLNLRVISATNKDLWAEVQKGNFREDLYFRLQGFVLTIPDLKDRGDDIIHIAKSYMSKFCAKQGIKPEKSLSPEAVKSMLEYSWPGNVRELKSMVERAVLVSENERIQKEDLIFLSKTA